MYLFKLSPNRGSFRKGYTITIENLLTQTSGIKDYMAISNPAADRINYTPKQGVDYFKDEL